MSQVARRYYERGTTAMANNDLTSAVEQLQAAVDLAPTFTNARIAFAVALARFGDTPRAANVLRSGVSRAVPDVSAAAMWATLGDVLTLGGDFFGAEEAFNQAATVPGFEARVASGRARVHAKLGRYPESMAELRKAAAISAGRAG